jgi:tartrate dehydratase beta subunit/fumarate hydratase class I family protein
MRRRLPRQRRLLPRRDRRGRGTRGENHIRKAEVIGFEEFGMEAAWRIEVEDFPAFVVIDDKGNDFYEQLARTRVIRMP